MTIKCWNDTKGPKTNEWTMWFAAVRRAAETMAGRMTSSVGRHLRFVPAEPLMMTSPSHGRRIVMRAAENNKKKIIQFFLVSPATPSFFTFVAFGVAQGEIGDHFWSQWAVWLRRPSPFLSLPFICRARYGRELSPHFALLFKLPWLLASQITRCGSNKFSFRVTQGQWTDKHAEMNEKRRPKTL